MYTITMWNRKSTNFQHSTFARMNGTGVIEVKTRTQALRIMGALIHDSRIHKAILNGSEGCLTWEQHQQNKPCSAQEAGDTWCDCDQCDGRPCNEEDNFDNEPL